MAFRVFLVILLDWQQVCLIPSILVRFLQSHFKKYCEENDIDTASVGPLINKSLKEKIKEEAEKLNLVERSSTAVLPI